VTELWSDDAVAAGVQRASQAYTRRRTALIQALARRGVPAYGRSGINVWVPVPDETAVVAALRERGFAAAPGSLYRQASGPGIRITVGALSESDVEALADAIATGLTPTPVWAR
jgi:DNA-binding transcriptional MocR family regulator